MTRKCNECTLCCRLLPVAEIGKPAGIRCSQQRANGCRVHGTAAFPDACNRWACLWLLDDQMPLPRPDRAHYVIDPAPDFILVEGHKMPVVQIWIDPRFPDAHRDPMLRTWLEGLYEAAGVVAVIRYDSTAGLVLFPPECTGAGWREARGKASVEHSPAEIFKALKELGQMAGPDGGETSGPALGT